MERRKTTAQLRQRQGPDCPDGARFRRSTGRFPGVPGVTLLLDSHAYLWFVEGDARISKRVRQLIEDPSNEVWLSLASAWEVSVRTSIGKLALSRSLHDTFVTISAANGIRLLPI